MDFCCITDLFLDRFRCPIEPVIGTATHYIMKKYKDHGTIMLPKKGSDRMVVTP